MSGADVDPVYDSELSGEFIQLRDRVYDRLRQAADVPNSQWCRVGQLLVLPSFANAYSWDVLRDPHGVYTLYRTCWRLDRDDPAFESRAERAKYPVPFVPTVEVTAIPFPSERLGELLGAFRGVSIAVGLEAPASGNDGVSFELLVGDFWGGCRLNWWCELPQEWRPLQSIVERLSEAFEAAWESRGDSAEPNPAT